MRLSLTLSLLLSVPAAALAQPASVEEEPRAEVALLAVAHLARYRQLHRVNDARLAGPVRGALLQPELTVHLNRIAALRLGAGVGVAKPDWKLRYPTFLAIERENLAVDTTPALVLSASAGIDFTPWHVRVGPTVRYDYVDFLRNGGESIDAVGIDLVVPRAVHSLNFGAHVGIALPNRLQVFVEPTLGIAWAGGKREGMTAALQIGVGPRLTR